MSTFRDYKCPLCGLVQRTFSPQRLWCSREQCKIAQNKLVKLPDMAPVLAQVPMDVIANGTWETRLDFRINHLGQE